MSSELPPASELVRLFGDTSSASSIVDETLVSFVAAVRSASTSTSVSKSCTSGTDSEVDDSVTAPLIVKEYFAADQACDSLFTQLEYRRVEKQSEGEHLVMEALACLLVAVVRDVELAGNATSVARQILCKCLRSVYRALSARQHHSIRAALRLMTAVVEVSPVIAKETLEVFDFTLKVLPSLGSSKNSRNRSNIRACFVRFVCAFLRSGDVPVVVQMLNMKNFVISMFSAADLTEDKPDLLLHIVDTLQNLLRLPLQRRTKLNLFTSKVLTQLAGLNKYKFSGNDIVSGTEKVRNSFHDLLVDVCSSPERGICFVPKILDEGQGFPLGTKASGQTSQSGNPVLLRFLISLDARDGRNRHLILSTLSTCGDLIAAYMREARLLSEPIISLRWLQRASLVGAILDLPHVSLLTGGVCSTLQYRLDSIFPFSDGSTILASGLQSKHRLIVFTCTKLLVLMINRLKEFIELVEKSYLTDMTARKFLDDIVRAAKRRIPQLEVLLAYRHRVFKGDAGEFSAVLQELALRSLLLYCRVFPDVVAAAKFDVSKCMMNSAQFLKLDIQVQLTLVQLVKARIDDFRWTNRLKNAKGDDVTFMHELLLSFVSTPSIPLQNKLLSLLTSMIQKTEVVRDGAQVKAWLLPLLSIPGAVGFVDDVFCRLERDTFRILEKALQIHAESVQGISVGNSVANLSVCPTLVAALDVFKSSSQALSPNPEELSHVTVYLSIVALNLFHNCLDKPLFASYFVNSIWKPTELVSQRIKTHLLSWLDEDLSKSHWDTKNSKTIGVAWLSSSARDLLPVVICERDLTVDDIIIALKPDGLPLFEAAFTPTWKPEDSKFGSGMSLFDTDLVQRVLGNGSPTSTSNSKIVFALFDALSPAVLLRNCNREGLFVDPLVQGVIERALDKVSEDNIATTATTVLHLMMLLSKSSRVDGTESQDAMHFCLRILLRLGQVVDAKADIVFEQALTCQHFQDLIRLVLTKEHYLYSAVIDILVLASTFTKSSNQVAKILETHFQKICKMYSELRAHTSSSITSVRVVRLNQVVDFLYHFHNLFEAEEVQHLLIDLTRQLNASSNIDQNSYLRVCQLLVNSRYAPMPLSVQQAVVNLSGNLNAFDHNSIGNYISNPIVTTAKNAFGWTGFHFPLSFPDSVCEKTFKQWIVESSEKHQRIVEYLVENSILHRTYLEQQWQLTAPNLDSVNCSIADRYTRTVLVTKIRSLPDWKSFALPKKQNPHCQSLIAADVIRTLCKAALQRIAVHMELVSEGLLCLTQAVLCSNTDQKSIRQSAANALEQLLNTDCSARISIIPRLNALCALAAVVDEVDTYNKLLLFLLTNVIDAEGGDVADGTRLLDEDLLLQFTAVHHLADYLYDTLTESPSHQLFEEGLDQAICRFHQLVAEFRLRDVVPLQAALAVLKLVLRTGSPQGVFYGQILSSPLYEEAMNHRMDVMILPSPTNTILFHQHLIAEKRRHHVGMLLLSIVESQPEVCNAEHFETLLQAYNASASKSDRVILDLLQLYEKSNLNVGFRAVSWGPGSVERRSKRMHTNDPVNAIIASLDKERLEWSIHNFSHAYCLRSGYCVADIYGDDLTVLHELRFYDPSFLLTVVFLVISKAETNRIELRALVESNILSYLIMGTSVGDSEIRMISYRCLGKFRALLDEARFRERLQVIAVLDSLKNAISSHGECISPLVAAFTAKAVVLAIHPGDIPMYTIVNKFVLSRSAIDLLDVPLFYTLFNSSSQHYRIERIWILRLLVVGVQAESDAKIMRRRRVLDLAMSLYDSTVGDVKTRKLVCDLLVATLKLPGSFGLDLMSNRGLLAWLHVLLLKHAALPSFKGVMEDAFRIVNCCLDILVDKRRQCTNQKASPTVAVQLYSIVSGLLAACDKDWTAAGNKDVAILTYLKCLQMVQQLSNMRTSTNLEPNGYIDALTLVRGFLTLFHSCHKDWLALANKLECRILRVGLPENILQIVLRKLLRILPCTSVIFCDKVDDSKCTIATFTISAAEKCISGDACEVNPVWTKSNAVSIVQHVPDLVSWVEDHLCDFAADSDCSIYWVQCFNAAIRLRSVVQRTRFEESTFALLTCNRMLINIAALARNGSDLHSGDPTYAFLDRFCTNDNLAEIKELCTKEASEMKDKCNERLDSTNHTTLHVLEAMDSVIRWCELSKLDERERKRVKVTPQADSVTFHR